MIEVLVQYGTPSIDINPLYAENAPSISIAVATTVIEVQSSDLGGAAAATVAADQAEQYALQAEAAAQGTIDFTQDLTVDAVGLPSGSQPTVEYDPNTIKMTFGIPAGGNSDLGGYPVVMSDVQNTDIVSFASNIMAWYNRRQTSLTDGGNF